MNHSKFKIGRLLKYDKDPSNPEQIEIPRDLKGLKEICRASQERNDFTKKGMNQSYGDILIKGEDVLVIKDPAKRGVYSCFSLNELYYILNTRTGIYNDPHHRSYLRDILGHYGSI